MVRVEKIREIAKEAALIITNKDLVFEKADIEVKTSKRDLATAYDLMVQEKIISLLAKEYPSIHVIGEEDTAKSDSVENTRRLEEFFLIDPIDGTTNFMHDFRHSSISIAYIKDGRQRLGLVMNPYNNEIFYATEGEGAYLNGKRIHVSDSSFSQSLVIFGTSPNYLDVPMNTFKILERVYERALDIRRTGSAALDLCYLAAGRADFFFELSLSPWDYAAGAFILKEAGGVATDFYGKSLPFDKPSSVVAGNPISYVEGIKVVNLK